MSRSSFQDKALALAYDTVGKPSGFDKMNGYVQYHAEVDKFYKYGIKVVDALIAQEFTPSATNQEKAEKLHNWLSSLKYGQEEILHAAVTCDYVGSVHFKNDLATQLELLDG